MGRTRAPLALDFIKPFGAMCIDRIDDGRDIEARNDLLPVGTEIVVIRVEPHENHVLVHLRAEFDPGDCFAGSINEQLARSGYCAPDGIAFTNRSAVTLGKGVYELSLSPGFLNPTQAMYAPRIIEGANGVHVAPVGGVVECVGQAAAHQVQLAVRAAAWEQQRREWEGKANSNAGSPRAVTHAEMAMATASVTSDDSWRR